VASNIPTLSAVELVRRGYFPREAPPPFSSEKLANLLARDQEVLQVKTRRSQCVRHNLARPNGFRRPLQIPNPRNFVPLALEFEAQWTAINAFLQGSSLSMSRPEVASGTERAVRPRFRLGERARLRPRDWRGQRFLLRTDVSQFYSSLYTHSIPWALEGKQKAKQNMGKTISDRLDKALRDISDGQTMGVPIGPDTSLLAAEIVLTAVDKKIAKGRKLRGHRYIDDYELTFTSRGEAEHVLVELEDALAEFELSINPLKTDILELPQPFQEGWAHDLLTFRIRTDSATTTITDLIALFSRAASVARTRSGPLKYALQRSREIDIPDTDVWSAFQNLVWSAVSSEPTTMPTALDVLTEKAQVGEFQVDKDAAAEVIEAMLLTHAPLRNSSEVAWALWAAIKLDIKLPRRVASAVSASDDDLVALLALDADERGLFHSHLDLSNWEALIDYDDVFSGSHWLLAYEVSVRKWLESARGRLGEDPFMKVLRTRRVRFYLPKEVRRPFTGPAGPLPGGLVPDEYV
jgi:hypothetical protein